MSDLSIGDLLRRLMPDEEEAIRAAPSTAAAPEAKPKETEFASQDRARPGDRPLIGMPPGAVGLARANQLGWRPSLDDPFTRLALSLTPPGAALDAYESGRQSLRDFNEGKPAVGSFHVAEALLSALGVGPAVRLAIKGLGRLPNFARSAVNEFAAAHQMAHLRPATAHGGGIAPDFAFMSRRDDLPMDEASRLGRARDAYRLKNLIWRGEKKRVPSHFTDGTTFSERKSDAARYGTPMPYVVDKTARILDAGKPVNGSDLSAIVAATWRKDPQLAQRLVNLAQPDGALSVEKFLGHAERYPNEPMAHGQDVIDALGQSDRATSLILADAGFNFARIGNNWITTSGGQPASFLRNLKQAAFDPGKRSSTNVFDAFPYALLGATPAALRFTHSNDDR